MNTQELSQETKIALLEKEQEHAKEERQELRRIFGEFVKKLDKHIDSEKKIWDEVRKDLQDNKSYFDQYSPLMKWILKAVGYVMFFFLNAMLIMLFLNADQIIEFI